MASQVEVLGPGFVVSTDTEEHGIVEARGTYLRAALDELCRRLSDLDVPTFTVERIDVRYEGPASGRRYN